MCIRDRHQATSPRRTLHPTAWATAWATPRAWAYLLPVGVLAFAAPAFGSDFVDTRLNVTLTNENAVSYTHLDVYKRQLRDQCGLLLSEFELLGVLLDSKERSLRMGELSDLLLMTPSGLTRVVDRLVQRKLLKRAAVTVDKRGSAIALLPRGLASYLRAKDVCDQTLRSVLADKLSASQQRTLIQALGPLSSGSRID